MKSSLTNIQKFIALSLTIISLYLINSALINVKTLVNQKNVIGHISNVNTDAKLVDNSRLPLAWGQADKPVNYLPSLSESIFFEVKEEEKEQVIELVKVEYPDYQALLNEKLIIYSVSKTGAIINSKFYRKGDYITGTGIVSADGNTLAPKLTSISNDYKRLTFFIDDEFIALTL